MTILHLERKFTSLTETFIINQINSVLLFSHAVFTIKELKNLPNEAKVFSPKNSLNTKYLSRSKTLFFKKIFDEVQPGLIHGHFLTDSRFFHPLTKQIKSIPKICSCYGYDVSRFPKKFGFLSSLYLKTIFTDYDIFLAMSLDMKKDLIKIGCPENKIIIHYHGIDTSMFKVERTYLPKDVLNLLTIGSLVEKKGHLTVLKALNELKNKENFVKFKYVIVGNGKLKARLKGYVEDHNLENEVFFIDAIKHGPEFSMQLQDADVFIHPSVITRNGDKEGIPGTIVEAMASGLPVVSTFHAGIPEIIESEFNGLLINEHDHLSLANHIKSLHTSHTLRETLGTNAKNTALNKLDIKIRNKHLQTIYAAALNKKKNEIR